MGGHIGSLLAAEPLPSVLPFSRYTAATEEIENSETREEKVPQVTSRFLCTAFGTRRWLTCAAGYWHVSALIGALLICWVWSVTRDNDILAQS